MKKIKLIGLYAVIGMATAGAHGVSYGAEIVGLGGNCLDVTEGKRSNGTPVQMWRCEGNENQQWRVDNGRIRWARTDMCLDVRDGKRGNGTTVQIWQCERGNRNQDFNVERNRIVWAGNNKCMDVSNGSTADGARVHMWDCQRRNPNQEWSVRGGRDRERPRDRDNYRN